MKYMKNFSTSYQDKKNLKGKGEVVEKYKNMDEDFEQNCVCGTAKCLYRIRHHSIRLMKWIAFYDENYEDINYFDLKASVFVV